MEKQNEEILSLWVKQEKNDTEPRGDSAVCVGEKFVNIYIYIRLPLEEYTGNQ